MPGLTTEQVKKPPVIVIGAGVSGLTSVKACLEEKVDVVCFEKSSNVGGLWRYKKKSEDGYGSIMKSTVINTSKEMTSFSDFPPPEDFPNFMHNRQVVEYLEDYCRHFQLESHLQLDHEVISVKKSKDYESSGQWIVKVLNKVNNETRDELASAVIVGSGHHSYPYIPSIEGLHDRFKGNVIHSHQYKQPENLNNRKVLVIGMGNSAGDVAVELSYSAQKVYLSSRRGSWVLPRLGDYGQPLDIQFGRRYIIKLLDWMPFWLKNMHAEYKLNSRYDHSMYNLRPEHHFYSQHPMVNDDLPGKLLSGSVTLKGPIDHFTEDAVIFQGEPHIQYPIDDVILATGYTIKFPFLEENLANLNENHTSLYKYIFPPQLEHNTLAFIGLVQPFGALPPICELQARWVLQVLQGHQSLPTPQQMENDINQKKKKHEQRYVNSRRHTIEVDSVPYLDELATLAGVQPSLKAMLLSTDFKLFYACLFGPCVPYQYRIQGPHKWNEARNTILNTPYRVLKPLKTRFPHNFSELSFKYEIKNIISSIIVIGVTIFLCFCSLI